MNHKLKNINCSDNDKQKKDQFKARADQRTHAKESQLQEGDWVLCRQQKVNKSTTPYNPDPYFIISIKGSQVKAKNSTHSITRHISFFKKLKMNNNSRKVVSTQKNIERETDMAIISDESEEDATTTPSPPTSDSNTIPYEEDVPSDEEQIQPRRSNRERRPPVRYRDNDK